MASSSNCCVVIFLAILLFSTSALASTKFIDAICKQVNDKAFCVKSLSAYSPAASATGALQAAEASIQLAKSYAQKCNDFVGKAGTPFKKCQDAFVTITKSLQSAAMELKESPDTANYDVKICSDSTTIVKNLIGKNTDKASKTVVMMTTMLEKFLGIALGATVTVGG